MYQYSPETSSGLRLDILHMKYSEGEKSGANGARTRDLLSARQALSQLSYGPNVYSSIEANSCKLCNFMSMFREIFCMKKNNRFLYFKLPPNQIPSNCTSLLLYLFLTFYFAILHQNFTVTNSCINAIPFCRINNI